MRIKIVQYNILNGGCGDNKPYIIDWKRISKISIILDKENADIVVLCEAGFWPTAVKKSFKKWNSFLHDLYTSPVPLDEQFRWGPIVVSRYPVVSYNTSRNVHHLTTLDVVLNIRGKEKKITVYHPHPAMTEEDKEKHLQKILEINSPDLLIGDFNALSPEDKYNYINLTDAFSKFMHDEAAKKINDMSSCLTISSILKAGFVDSFISSKKSWMYTMPTDLRSTDKSSGIRIDYIMSKAMKVIDAGIIKNKLTEKASDHYPIYAILEI